jgi:hypothetical protein
MIDVCNRDNRMSSRKDCGHRETKLVLCDKMAMEGSQSGSIKQSCCPSENCMLLEISNPNRQKNHIYDLSKYSCILIWTLNKETQNIFVSSK